MKVLVTGATGFLGSELTRQLVADGANVRILRLPAASLDLLGGAAQQVEQVTGDITDVTTLKPALTGIDRVYHSAAHVGFSGARGHAKLHRVNVAGTANVVNAALEADVERLLHTSSIVALGHPDSDDRVIDEATSWQPSPLHSPYARSKHQAELEIHRGRAEGLNAVITNPALLFGPAPAGQTARRVAEAVRDGKLPGVPAGGTNVVDVRDAAAGQIRAMRHGQAGERYFLGSENLSWRAIIDTLATAFGVTPPRFTIPPRLLTGAAVFFEAVTTLTRSSPLLTRATARTASRFPRYSNRKAISKLGCTFRPFAHTAQHLAARLARAPS